MYKTEVESKFAPNQEVWFMINNRPVKKVIKYISFKVFEKHTLLKYVIERFMGYGDDLEFTKDKIFLTKEELIKSL